MISNATFRSITHILIYLYTYLMSDATLRSITHILIYLCTYILSPPTWGYMGVIP